MSFHKYNHTYSHRLKYGHGYNHTYPNQRDGHHSHGDSKFPRYESYTPTQNNISLKPSAPKIQKPVESNGLNIAKNQLEGTDITTGVNSHDSKFPTLLIHADHLKDVVISRDPSKVSNFKVVYDPELDKSLSKSDKKTKRCKLKVKDNHAQVHDPRLSFQGGLESYLHKPNKRSKKFPFKQLPQTKFVYDKDSLGPEPSTEIVLWDLPTSVSEVYISNYFKTYGNPIKDLKFVNDSQNGAPLGIATFKFQGSLEKSARLADKVVSDAKANGLKLDGVQIKISLNDPDNTFLSEKIKAAEGKLRASILKLQEEKKKAKLLEEEEERKRQAKIQTKVQVQEPVKDKTAIKEPKETLKTNITITSRINNNRVVPGIFLPSDLNRYIKHRPFLFIRDKYIPTKRISSLDIKRVLSKYSWTRVLNEREGFFIVFNSLKECERCFYKEDGKKFYEYSMIMELAIPKGFRGDNSSADVTRTTDVINEASNMLIKDFETYLTKDIRERVIAPVILDLLSEDRYPELMSEIKQKESQKKELQSTVLTNDKLKKEALSLLVSRRNQNLPSFRKKQTAKTLPNKRPIIPMLHALNFNADSDESDDESSRSMTPVATGFKRQHSSTTSVTTEDQEEEASIPKKKYKRSFLYDSSNDEMEVEEDEEEVEPEKEQRSDAMEQEVDYSQLNELYRPTFDYVHPVYEAGPELPSEKLDLEILTGMVRDEEDYEILKEVLKEQETTNEIKNIEYWAWKMRESNRNVPDIVQDEEELILPLDQRLESTTGAFKSEGYKKIPDIDKNEYLPHRRKVHKPLKTVQHDDETEKGNQQNPNTHSSRVNRANNRRLAADISAQKQMIGSETDILNLNALTKRKKPVSFARSAIHNWGLYALEPIAAKEMIIEYVGESIRQQVAEHRERSYLKTGIGSSYLFRIDENTVIDATKKGGIARFINHCCNPSCTAKIIKVEGKKRIVIYALRDIEANEELTYDYKFERETNDNERIRCLCGAPGCKGYLN